MGLSCRVALDLRDLNLRIEAYPFDWIKSNADGIVECIQNDFTDFHKDFIRIDESMIFDKYNFGYSHDYPTIKTEINENNSINDDIFIEQNIFEKDFKNYHAEVLEKYSRRIKRFQDTMNSKDNILCFICLNLYDDTNDCDKIMSVINTKYIKKNIAFILYTTYNSNLELCIHNEKIKVLSNNLGDLIKECTTLFLSI